MDRRDLLRKFGIGALIVPIIGGQPEKSAAAQLIEIPKIRPVELVKELPEKIQLADVQTAELVLTMQDGTRHSIEFNTWEAKGFLHPGHVTLEAEVCTVSQHTSPASFPKTGSLYLSGYYA